ncbi:hypothetical protein [Desulfonatronospira sp.]|uniref:hypothetical protein n=1 Tax=Desulfonatronospira sp. TaxID=1962951 RepID=UPI0025B8FA35|nr:hypothetical protein [Desulfonatronospira sp.]
MTEKDALSQAGVVLPDPGKQAEHIARRWQRPLMLAENTLLLVCPESSSSGEEQFPHPMWDELVGRIKDDKQASVQHSGEAACPGLEPGAGIQVLTGVSYSLVRSWSACPFA